MHERVQLALSFSRRAVYVKGGEKHKLGLVNKEIALETQKKLLLRQFSALHLWD